MNFLIKPLLFLIFITLFGACKKTLPYRVNSSEAIYTETSKDIPEDAKIKAIIEPYKKKLEAQMSEIIGYAEKEIDGSRSANESLIGNFVVDICANISRKHSKQSIDMAFITFGGLRANVPKGAVRVGDIFELMPFENEMVVLELDAATLRELFVHLVNTRTMAISNSKILIEAGKLKDVLINNEPIDEKRNYFVVTSDYLAFGGDNLTFLSKAKSKTFLDIKLRDMIIESIRASEAQGKKITATTGGRVEERP